tara:strand:+ start:425 stop:1138 length:714 start_codon:yes stop_codon:yes gene_type:complete
MWKAEIKLEHLYQIYRGKRNRENQCCVCLSDLPEPNELCPEEKNATECEEFCGSRYKTSSSNYKACKRRYSLNILSCGHELCEECKLGMLSRGQKQCPICRQATIEDSYLHLDDLGENISQMYEISFENDDIEEEVNHGVSKQGIIDLLNNKFSVIDSFNFTKIRIFKRKRQYDSDEELHREYWANIQGFNMALNDLYTNDFKEYFFVYLQVIIGYTVDARYPHDLAQEISIQKIFP